MVSYRDSGDECSGETVSILSSSAQARPDGASFRDNSLGESINPDALNFLESPSNKRGFSPPQEVVKKPGNRPPGDAAIEKGMATGGAPDTGFLLFSAGPFGNFLRRVFGTRDDNGDNAAPTRPLNGSELVAPSPAGVQVRNHAVLDSSRQQASRDSLEAA